MTGGKWWWCWWCWWLASVACLVPASQSPASTTRDDDALTGHKLSLVPVSARLTACLFPLLLFTLHDRDKGKSNLHLSKLTEYHISRQYATCCSTKRPVHRKKERKTHTHCSALICIASMTGASTTAAAEEAPVSPVVVVVSVRVSVFVCTLPQLSVRK